MIQQGISKNENHFPHIIEKGPMAFAIRPFLLFFKQIIDQFMSL